MATKKGKVQAYLEDDIAILLAGWKDDRGLSDSAAINEILRDFFGAAPGAAPGAGNKEQDIKALIQSELEPLKNQIFFLSEKILILEKGLSPAADSRLAIYLDSPDDSPPESLPESLSDSPPELLPDSRLAIYLDSPDDSPPESLPESLSDSPPESLPDSPPESLSDSPPELLPDSPPELLPDSLPESLPDSLPESLPDSLPELRSKKRNVKKGDRISEPLRGKQGEILSVTRKGPRKYTILWDGGRAEEYSQKEFNEFELVPPPLKLRIIYPSSTHKLIRLSDALGAHQFPAANQKPLESLSLRGF